MAYLLLLLAQDAVPLRVWHDDGLRFRAEDGSFEGYLTGFVRVHGRTIFDRPDDETAPLRTVPDSIFVRQGRFDLGGVYQRTWAFRVTADFATGTYDQDEGTGPTSTGVLLRDAWLEWRHSPAVALRAGQFFVPLSAEEVDPARWLEFAERAPGNRLAPGRALGLGAAGDLFEGILRYHAMLYQGNDLLQDQGRSRADENDEKGTSLLVYAWPLPFLRLGAGASVADVDDVPADGFDLVSTELSVLYLDSTGGTFDVLRRRAEARILFLAGPPSLTAEFLWREDDPRDAADLESWGDYVQGTSLQTGEQLDYRAAGAGTLTARLRRAGAMYVAARMATTRPTMKNGFVRFATQARQPPTTKVTGSVKTQA
jgi:phosphate-selective porin